MSGPKIAFIACNRNAGRFRGDPSFIHRCENLSLAQEALGNRPVLLHLESLPVRAGYEFALFHRPSHSLRLRVAASLLRVPGCGWSRRWADASMTFPG